MNFLNLFRVKVTQNITKKIKILNISKKFEIPEKWKGGRLEKWGLYWREMYIDYKAVGNDVIVECKAKPRKAFAISTGIFLMIAAIKTNPDQTAFHNQLVDNTKELITISHIIRNTVSENHMELLTTWENQGVLRQMNLLFFSIMWIDDYDSQCKLYAAQCSYLRPEIFRFYHRIIDVGIYGYWWYIKWKMQNFDINPVEWDANNVLK